MSTFAKMKTTVMTTIATIISPERGLEKRKNIQCLTKSKTTKTTPKR